MCKKYFVFVPNWIFLFVNSNNITDVIWWVNIASKISLKLNTVLNFTQTHVRQRTIKWKIWCSTRSEGIKGNVSGELYKIHLRKEMNYIFSFFFLLFLLYSGINAWLKHRQHQLWNCHDKKKCKTSVGLNLSIKYISS